MRTGSCALIAYLTLLHVYQEVVAFKEEKSFLNEDTDKVFSFTLTSLFRYQTPPEATS